VKQYPAEKERVIRTSHLIQAEASFIDRLVREALYPERPSQHRSGERPSQHRSGERPIIRIGIKHGTAIFRRDGKSKHAFQILLGLARSTPREKRDAHLLIG
jgi:hypothetical protein